MKVTTELMPHCWHLFWPRDNLSCTFHNTLSLLDIRLVGCCFEVASEVPTAAVMCHPCAWTQPNASPREGWFCQAPQPGGCCLQLLPRLKCPCLTCLLSNAEVLCHSGGHRCGTKCNLTSEGGKKSTKMRPAIKLALQKRVNISMKTNSMRIILLPFFPQTSKLKVMLGSYCPKVPCWFAKFEDTPWSMKLLLKESLPVTNRRCKTPVKLVLVELLTTF